MTDSAAVQAQKFTVSKTEPAEETCTPVIYFFVWVWFEFGLVWVEFGLSLVWFEFGLILILILVLVLALAGFGFGFGLGWIRFDSIRFGLIRCDSIRFDLIWVIWFADLILMLFHFTWSQLFLIALSVSASPPHPPLPPPPTQYATSVSLVFASALLAFSVPSQIIQKSFCAGSQLANMQAERERKKKGLDLKSRQQTLDLTRCQSSITPHQVNRSRHGQ